MHIFVEYCAAHPILTVFLIVSAVLTLIFGGIFAFLLYQMKQAPQIKDSETAPKKTDSFPINDSPKESPAKENPVKEMQTKGNATDKNRINENDTAENIQSSAPVTAEISSQAKKKTNRSGEQKNKPAEKTKKAAAKKTEKTSNDKTKKAEKRKDDENNKDSEKTKAESLKTERSKNKKSQKIQKSIPKNENKEPIMLLDELKDVDNEIDFYEEDETDRIARYRGKWIICRVVTEERSASNQKSDEDDMYFFELHASNGERLLSSEEYTTYNGVLRGIETHKTNILRGNFKITLSKKGDYIFKLLSGKNLLLCMGEKYSTKAACESAIESTKRFAQTAIVDENIQDHVVKVPVEDDDTEPLPLPDGHNGKWVISERKGADEENIYYFELFANNGEKLLSSEEYTTYIGAVNGIQTHKSNISEGNFRVMLTKRGDYIYKLLNRNGQLLCLGEHYRTKRRCLNAVESVKRFAKYSPVLTSVKNKD